MAGRRRRLHACAASVLAIIHTAGRKAQELNGPLGTWAKRITKGMSLFIPLIYAVQWQWLAILSFTDDCILTFEKLAETIFPPSALLFQKIDELVSTAEVMPGRLDEALDGFNVLMRRIPFLDWALMQILWWGENIEEKDIMVDTNSSSNVMTELPAVSKSKNKEKVVSFWDPMEREVKKENAQNTVEPSTSDQNGNLVVASQVDSSQEKSIHGEKEEPLPPWPKTTSDASREKKPISDTVEGSKKETNGKLKESEENEGTNKKKEEMNKKDPVLHLFESRWLL